MSSRPRWAQVWPLSVERYIAVAVADVGSEAGFPSSHVNDVGIGAGDGDGAHGGDVEEAVGDVSPIGPTIGGLPDPAGAGAEVEGHWVMGITGDGHYATAAVRPD